MIERIFSQPYVAGRRKSGAGALGRPGTPGLGMFTSLATLPMIIDMFGALAITGAPLLWWHALLYPHEGGVARLNPDRAQAVVT